MKTSEKNKRNQVKKWQEVLYSSDYNAIKQLLRYLRDKGNEKILPDIIKIYKGYKNTELGDFVFDFLTDLKSSETVPIFIKFIDDNEFADIKPDLLSLCWQTRLDFSDYLDFFTEIFIKSDLNSAFEAFTVIEYFEYDNKKNNIEENIEKLQKSIDKIDSQKKELLVDLVNILRNKQK